MIRVLSLHAVAPGSNPVLTSGQDLFLVVLDSTIPRILNSQLVASCQLGFLIMFQVKFKYWFFQIIKSAVLVN